MQSQGILRQPNIKIERGFQMSSKTEAVPPPIQPFAAVENPTHQTVWIIGVSETIVWVAGGCAAQHVRLSTDGGQTFQRIGNVPGSAQIETYTYPYVVQAPPTTQAVVRITVLDASGVERASGDSKLFTIKAQGS
jgi:hypothetical protein